MENVIAAIDIWSSKIRTIIGTFSSSDSNVPSIRILWVWISESNAIRKWNILDMEEFSKNLDKSLFDAESMSGENIYWAFVSFNSSSFDVVNNKWIIAVSGDEIDASDVERVLEMAKNGLDMPNREVLKIIPDTFVVDFEEWIKSPIWMSARKLEVRANIFSSSTNVLNNIRKAVEDSGVEVYDIFPNLISAPEWVLTKRQKELGVVCIDIWASITWFTVYEEWSLKFSGILPIWWDSVTNDIALWLRTSIDVAEKLKLEYWVLNLEKKEWYKDTNIDLKLISKTEQWEVSSLYLSKIITARYDEIFYMIRQELKKVWYDWMLPEWAVLVWWWAKMNWLLDLAKESLRLPCSIWFPSNIDYINETSLSDPTFASVIWDLVLANKYRNTEISFSLNFWSIFESFVKVFKKMLPK